jgi:hypothetical protein
MSSMLLTHRGAIRLDRAQLANIPAPEPTDTWKPVSRAQLVSALTDILIIRVSPSNMATTDSVG